MLKKSLAVGIIVFLVISSVPYSILSTEISTGTFDGNTLYVGGTGPSNYSKIQDAINDSSNRDTIFVFNGTYYENLFIDKTINLIGEDKYTTIIDGGMKERCDVVHIRPKGDGILLSGFTIQYSGQITGQLCYDVGVEIHSDYNTISDNIITNNHDGIFIYASNNNNIINNVIRDSNYSGIAFFSGSNNTISFNNLSNNRNGIEVRNTGMSNENTFSDNVISNNFFGIKLWHSRNIINRNNFINNSRQAVTRFNVPRFSPSRNSWDANYWDDWVGVGPKHIPGFFGFNFDWHPVSEPYEIIIGRDDDSLYSSSFGDGDTKYWAVISAVGNNPHQIIQCSRDLKAIYNVMINHGWNDENIKVLLEEEATKEAIIGSFQWLNESGEDEDDVIFFFSNSHGYYMDDQPPLDEPDGKDGFILPFDCDWETWDNCILDDELAVEFDKLKSKNIFIVIDSCHAGEFIDGSSDLCKSGRVVLTGCDVEELGGPLLVRMRWLFPYYFTKGLNGPADKNNDNFVSAEETFSYAKLPVMIRSTLFNLIRSQTLETQHPQIYDGWPSEENNGEELNLIDLKKGFISEEI